MFRRHATATAGDVEDDHWRAPTRTLCDAAARSPFSAGAMRVPIASPQEITDARIDWEESRRFGEVTGYSGPRLVAPSLTKFANPNPAS